MQRFSASAARVCMCVAMVLPGCGATFAEPDVEASASADGSAKTDAPTRFDGSVKMDSAIRHDGSLNMDADGRLDATGTPEAHPPGNDSATSDSPIGADASMVRESAT